LEDKVDHRIKHGRIECQSATFLVKCVANNLHALQTACLNQVLLHRQHGGGTWQTPRTKTNTMFSGKKRHIPIVMALANVARFPASS
jgi:hypothetical protein